MVSLKKPSPSGRRCRVAADEGAEADKNHYNVAFGNDIVAVEMNPFGGLFDYAQSDIFCSATEMFMVGALVLRLSLRLRKRFEEILYPHSCAKELV